MIDGQTAELAAFTQLREKAIVAAVPLDDTIQATGMPVQMYECMSQDLLVTITYHGPTDLTMVMDNKKSR
jgi:hypothetical protein